MPTYRFGSQPPESILRTSIPIRDDPVRIQLYKRVESAFEDRPDVLVACIRGKRCPTGVRIFVFSIVNAARRGAVLGRLGAPLLHATVHD